jgi:hypothetical protein
MTMWLINKKRGPWKTPTTIDHLNKFRHLVVEVSPEGITLRPEGCRSPERFISWMDIWSLQQWATGSTNPPPMKGIPPTEQPATSSPAAAVIEAPAESSPLKDYPAIIAKWAAYVLEDSRYIRPVLSGCALMLQRIGNARSIGGQNTPFAASIQSKVEALEMAVMDYEAGAPGYAFHADAKARLEKFAAGGEL